ncbi:unnamed protein product [Rhodiola kirilowii]
MEEMHQRLARAKSSPVRAPEHLRPSVRALKRPAEHTKDPTESLVLQPLRARARSI